MRVCRILFFCVSALLAAERDPGAPKIAEMVTDRPDFTESAEIVPLGWFNLESGFQFDRSEDRRGYTFGAPLLRLGVGKRWELRLATDGIVGRRDALDPILEGMADASIGIKYKLVKEARWMPAIALLAIVSLPTGHPAFSRNSVDPAVKLALAKDIPFGFSFSGNVNYQALSDDSGRYHQNAISLSIGHGFGDRLAGFWEIYSFNCDDRASGRLTVFQTGLTVAAGQNGQLDFTVGRRLTAVGPDWVVGFGWATRHAFGLPGWLKP